MYLYGASGHAKVIIDLLEGRRHRDRCPLRRPCVGYGPVRLPDPATGTGRRAADRRHRRQRRAETDRRAADLYVRQRRPPVGRGLAPALRSAKARSSCRGPSSSPTHGSAATASSTREPPWTTIASSATSPTFRPTPRCAATYTWAKGRRSEPDRSSFPASGSAAGRSSAPGRSSRATCPTVASLREIVVKSSNI